MTVDPTVPQPLQAPPPIPPRTIVLCFDGTSSQFDETNTNIVKFHGLLKKNPLEQFVYYQAGVGTYVNPGVVNPRLTWFAKIMDALFASYINDHVKSGYKFLMQNYREGDEVCLFGFSRGAHTARALAGLLHKIGLLPRDNDEQIAFAYSLYTSTDKAGLKLAAGFKQTFCTPVPIKFIGVWDTVASVGLVYGRDLPFSAGHSGVDFFRHALSLDERRARFQPRLYVEESEGSASHVNTVPAPRSPEPSGTAMSHKRAGSGSDFAVRRLSSQDHYRIHGISSRTPSNSNSLSPERNEPPATSSTPVDIPRVLEVWFAGCHSDVGGGSVEDTVRYSLGDISLRWMIKQVRLSGCGIEFDSEALRRADIDIEELAPAGPAQRTVEQTISSAPLSPSTEGGSEVHLLRERKELETQILSQEPEVLADIHDELSIGFADLSWGKLRDWLGFWVLELIIPATFIWQDSDGRNRRQRRWNRGNGRIIRSDPLYFHESVRKRKAVADPQYKPSGKPELKERIGNREPQYVQ